MGKSFKWAPHEGGRKVEFGAAAAVHKFFGGVRLAITRKIVVPNREGSSAPRPLGPSARSGSFSLPEKTTAVKSFPFQYSIRANDEHV